jgi:putative tricarboxylic transport membrane protein
MSNDLPDAAGGGPTQRGVEIGVAVGTAVFALIVMYGSVKAGIGWGDEGPKAGFFPFYVGLTILIASVANFIHGLAGHAGERFAEWGQLRMVLTIVVPTALYVGVMPWVGIYVSSAVLIAFFMKRLGNYGWSLIGLIAIGMPLVTFLVFERWFMVPLPKGPIEFWLGL